MLPMASVTRRRPTALAMRLKALLVLCTFGGRTKLRMIGCSVTTLMKIEMIQKADTKASFCISGIVATAMVMIARPSAMIDTIAGAYRLTYDRMIARFLSLQRKYSSW